jgi:hypothetical protein
MVCGSRRMQRRVEQTLHFVEQFSFLFADLVVCVTQGFEQRYDLLCCEGYCVDHLWDFCYGAGRF